MTGAAYIGPMGQRSDLSQDQQATRQPGSGPDIGFFSRKEKNPKSDSLNLRDAGGILKMALIN